MPQLENSLSLDSSQSLSLYLSRGEVSPLFIELAVLVRIAKGLLRSVW